MCPLKALYGIKRPKGRGVKEVLLAVKHRFPKWLSREIEGFTGISERLARAREPSMYGDGKKGFLPSKLFGKKEARTAVGDAQAVHGL